MEMERRLRNSIQYMRRRHGYCRGGGWNDTISQINYTCSCIFSSSVCELVELIYETLEEACESSALYAGRLFYTVRNILTLYCHVVPTAHAHELATLPQQAGTVLYWLL